MNSREAPLVSRNDLAGLVTALRRLGQSIGTVNGCFDVLHSGHVSIIREAAQQADVLICGVNSDRSVRALKGPGRPICVERERIAVLAALRWIDYITVFDEPDPILMLEIIRPDVHTNGSDYGPDCIEAPTVSRYGGRIHIVERVDSPSTTALLDRICSLDL